VARINDGEVSYVADEVQGTTELRGPVGGYFVWVLSEGGPLLLIAGASGIAPLLAMRLPATRSRGWLFSLRGWGDIIYRPVRRTRACDRAGPPGK
jgi:ferredoxin-NADP reductase